MIPHAKKNFTSWGQLVQQVSPHCPAIVSTSHRVGTEGSAERMILKPGSTSVEADSCIPMPGQSSALVSEQCIALNAVCDHYNLIGVGLKRKLSIPLIYRTYLE